MSGTGLLNDIEILDEDGDALTLAESRITGARAVLIETQTRCDGDIKAGVCVRFDEERVRKLVAWGQAWLDAPRLAARATADVVASDDGYRLLRTPFEWGVSFGGNDEPAQSPGELWFGGDNAEREARRLFADERDKVVCECGAEVDEGETISTEDGDVCPACADVLHEEFKVTSYRCPGCGWSGKGADIIAADAVCHGEPGCPQCEAAVEGVVEPGPGAAGEAPTP